MPERRQPAAREGFPPSPCRQICTLDDHDVCLGCERTMREIMQWSQMTAAEQRAVIAALPARRALRPR